MEAGNVLLVPGLLFWIGEPRRPLELLAFSIAALAAAGLLVVGARYWFGLDRKLRSGDRRSLDGALRFADAAQRPALVATMAAGIASVGLVAVEGWSGPAFAAGGLSLLAALEYVNYYHWQLQHFDNAADTKRLLTTGRLRPAHMARHLAAYRADLASERIAHEDRVLPLR